MCFRHLRSGSIHKSSKMVASDDHCCCLFTFCVCCFSMSTVRIYTHMQLPIYMVNNISRCVFLQTKASHAFYTSKLRVVSTSGDSAFFWRSHFCFWLFVSFWFARAPHFHIVNVCTSHAYSLIIIHSTFIHNWCGGVDGHVTTRVTWLWSWRRWRFCDCPSRGIFQLRSCASILPRRQNVSNNRKEQMPN